MKIAQFKKKGGVIQVNVTSGFAQAGSYSLILWESNQNRVVDGYPKRGNFINTAPNTDDLPQPNKMNDGRVVECVVTVALTPSIKDYDVGLEIFQDGKSIGLETANGQSDEPTATLDVFIVLLAT